MCSDRYLNLNCNWDLPITETRIYITNKTNKGTCEQFAEHDCCVCRVLDEHVSQCESVTNEHIYIVTLPVYVMTDSEQCISLGSVVVH